MPAITSWEEFIQFITDGENVEGSVANRTPHTLDRRTRYLYERLQAASLGEAVFLYSQAVETDAIPGSVLYYDAATSMYKRAQAAVAFNVSAGWYTLAESSFPVAMVYEKVDTNLAHLIMIGTLRDFDLSSVIEGGDATVSGPYYLSATAPGKITTQKPAVGVYVLFNRGDDTFHFLPTPRDVLEDHIHYRFELYAQPAGEANCVTYGDPEPHQVINPNPTLPGWLPADHYVFSGTAPTGAKFGYNLAQHPELEKVWPPLPTENCYIERNGVGLPMLGAPRPGVVIDCNGIWWMEDCYGAAPWAPEYPGCVYSSSSWSSEYPSSSSGEPYWTCQTPIEYLPANIGTRGDEMTLVLGYAKMIFKTSDAMVTELSPCSDTSPIIFLNCDGEPASTGKLCAALDLSVLGVVTPSPGIEVVKGFTEDTVLKGPSVNGIIAGSGAQITGVGVEDEDWSLDEAGLYHGDLQIQLEDTAGDPKEYQVSLVALNDVLEEYDSVNEFFYLHYPSGRTSGVRGRIEIPRLGMSTPLKMRLWMWFVGRSAGAMPLLTATYRRYPRPTVPTALPTTDTDIVGGGWTPGLTLAGGQYAEAYTPWFAVVMGDMVDFTLQWSGSSGPADGFGIARFGSRVEVGTP